MIFALIIGVWELVKTPDAEQITATFRTQQDCQQMNDWLFKGQFHCREKK